MSPRPKPLHHQAHTYIHTYIHTYVRTYIHTHTHYPPTQYTGIVVTIIIVQYYNTTEIITSHLTMTSRKQCADYVPTPPLDHTLTVFPIETDQLNRSADLPWRTLTTSEAAAVRGPVQPANNSCYKHFKFSIITTKM